MALPKVSDDDATKVKDAVIKALVAMEEARAILHGSVAAACGTITANVAAEEVGSTAEATSLLAVDTNGNSLGWQ